LLLQARGRLTAQELAAELEISVRTVYRDIEALGAAGVPVYADRGPIGGYQLLGGYRTRLTGLTSDEAESLFLAGIPGPAAELGLGTVLATAQLKLMAALPPDLRSRAGRIRERFHLDAPAWFRDADQPLYLAAIADAVWEQRAMRMRYQRWATPREVVRMLEPLGIVLKAGLWYLVARVHDTANDSAEHTSTEALPGSTDIAAHANQIRIYRVSRILALEILPDHFERPGGFDLANFWRAWSDHFEARIYRGEATVRFAPGTLERLDTLLSPAVARAARESACPPDTDGWVRATIPIESIEHACADLLRLRTGVEVLGPPELRARMTQIVRTLAQTYAVT
jgi:predicted DNA-binding transcriptional regulator YafY